MSNVTGIGAILDAYLTYILKGLDKGFIPVCDLKHFKNQYFKDGRIWRDNVWEYFFEQPCGMTLEDVENSELIVRIADAQKPLSEYSLTCNHLPVNQPHSNDKRIENLKNRRKECIKFNSEMTEYVENEYKKIIGNDENILGVLCRGTDYYIRKPAKEHVQPNPLEVIEKIKEFTKKHPEITKIYLATEDENIYEIFKDEFGDKLIDNNQYRYTYDAEKKNFIAKIKVDRPDHNYQLAKEYLASLYILSKCKYFVGGRCGGTKIAWIMQDNWQDVYIWKLGKYGSKNYRLKHFFFSKDVEYKQNIPYVVYTIFGIKFARKYKFRDN